MYLAMELLEGETLKDLVQGWKKKPDPRTSAA